MKQVTEDIYPANAHVVDDIGATWAVTAPHGNFDILELDTPATGSYTLTFRNGVRYIFSGADLKIPGNTAALSRIEDPWGNQLNFSYTAGNLTKIEDNLGIAGRTGLTLAYTGDKLTTITDWSNRTWSYGYDANDRLTSVTDPLSNTKTYSYQNDSNYLKDLILPEDRDSNGSGDVKTTFTYYRNGKAFTNVNSYGHGETVDYDLYRKRTRITGPRGFVRTHHYNKDGAMTKLLEPNGGILRFKNNQDGLRYAKTDALGFETQYSYRTDRSLGANASDTYGLVTLEQDALGNTLEYNYGPHDQITALKDKNGNTITRTYYSSTDGATGALKDKVHQIKTTVNGVANVVLQELKYYINGSLKQQINYIDPADLSRKRITDYNYDSNGFNLTDIYVNGSGTQIHTHYTYDSLGRRETETLYRRTSATDPTLIALISTYEYDSLGRVIKATSPRGDIAETVYDDNGNVIEEKAHYKKPDTSYDTRTFATHTYDSADRRTTTTDIYSNTTTFTYDKGGKLLSTIDALGHSNRFEYDSMGRLIVAINANGHRVETKYDLAGRVTQTIDPNGNAVLFEYDALGRQTKIITPLGNETQMAYSPNGNLISAIDANAVIDPLLRNSQGTSTYTEYDELGRTTRTVNAEDGETLMTYNLLGNLTSITDAEGQTTSYIYDDLGRLQEVIDPLVEAGTDKTVTLTYDELGNVLTRTDRKGQVTQHTYDSLNRLTQTDYLADGSAETYGYNLYGNLETLANNDITYSYDYDLKGRLTSKTDNRGNKTLNWEYDAVGNVIKKTDYQNEETHYQYDNSNRLVGERNSAYLQVSYHYDPAGRLLNRILSNGARTNYKYDADNRLISLENYSANGTKVHSQKYGHDRIGNINEYKDEAGTVTTSFSYDPLYRLLNADYPGTTNDLSYSYDKVGNRKTKTDQSGVVAYNYSLGNRLLDVRQSTEIGPIIYSYDYDDNGNRITKKDSIGTVLQSYNFNPKNRITGITTATDVHSFQYDPSGYRVEKQATAVGTRRYYLEAEHLEAVYDDSDVLKEKYLRGVVVDEVVNGYHYHSADEDDWTNYTYHHDQLRSVTALSGHNGSTEQTIVYGPFGEEISSIGNSGNAMKYTGREADAELGLYYYRARYYDPEVGRFITEDPLGFEAGVNFYAYVGNNPINASDPSGNVTLSINQMNTKNPGYSIEDVTPLIHYTEVALETSVAVAGATVVMAGATAGLSYVAGQSYSTIMAPEFIVGATDVTTSVLGSGAPAMSIAGVTAWGLSQLGNVADAISAPSPHTEFPSYAPDTGFSPGAAGMPPVIDMNNLQPSYINNGSVPDISANDFGASGGFVLYPNKMNQNMLLSVYSK